MNSVKRKAVEDLPEKPSKVIRYILSKTYVTKSCHDFFGDRYANHQHQK